MKNPIPSEFYALTHSDTGMIFTGTHLTAKDCRKKAVSNFGRKWKELFALGYRPTRVFVFPAGERSLGNAKRLMS